MQSDIFDKDGVQYKVHCMNSESLTDRTRHVTSIDSGGNLIATPIRYLVPVVIPKTTSDKPKSSLTVEDLEMVGQLLEGGLLSQSEQAK